MKQSNISHAKEPKTTNKRIHIKHDKLQKNMDDDQHAALKTLDDHNKNNNLTKRRSKINIISIHSGNLQSPMSKDKRMKMYSSNSNLDTDIIDEYKSQGYKLKNIIKCMEAARNDPNLTENYLLNVCYLNIYSLPYIIISASK